MRISCEKPYPLYSQSFYLRSPHVSLRVDADLHALRFGVLLLRHTWGFLRGLGSSVPAASGLRVCILLWQIQGSRQQSVNFAYWELMQRLVEVWWKAEALHAGSRWASTGKHLNHWAITWQTETSGSSVQYNSGWLIQVFQTFDCPHKLFGYPYNSKYLFRLNRRKKLISHFCMNDPF